MNTPEVQLYKKSVPWELRIEKVSNGYVIRFYEETQENFLFETTSVIKEDEFSEFGETEALVELLYSIKEHFGINVRLEIKPVQE